MNRFLIFVIILIITLLAYYTLFDSEKYLQTTKIPKEQDHSTTQNTKEETIRSLVQEND